MRFRRASKRQAPEPAPAAHQPIVTPPPPPPPPNTDSLVYELLANVALRDLTVIERLLSVISDVERGEQDPERLAFFYSLDHDITRLRRSAENALVLAGAQAPMGRTEPMTLLDVVRAAASESADYTRVSVGQLPLVAVGPAVADDLAHTLAELMDNALNVSPTRARVNVSGSWAKGGVLLAVEDEGIGIPPELLPELNARLTGPLALDATSTRQIGLYVVAHLARRHGIYVQLQTRRQLGSAAVAFLPERLVLDASAAMRPATFTPAAARIPGQSPMGPNPTHIPPPAGAAVPVAQPPGAAMPAEQRPPAGYQQAPQEPALREEQERQAEEKRLRSAYELDPLNPHNPIPPALRTYGSAAPPSPQRQQPDPGLPRRAERPVPPVGPPVVPSPVPPVGPPVVPSPAQPVGPPVLPSPAQPVGPPVLPSPAQPVGPPVVPSPVPSASPQSNPYAARGPVAQPHAPSAMQPAVPPAVAPATVDRWAPTAQERRQPTEFTSEGLPRRTRPAAARAFPGVPVREARRPDPASVLSDLEAFSAGTAEAFGTPYAPVALAPQPPPHASAPPLLTDPAQEEF